MDQTELTEKTAVEAAENGKKATKKAKKILLIVGGAFVALLLALLLFLWLLPEKEQPQYDIYFYPVVDENIFENQQYLDKNRFVYYCDDPQGYGLTEQITDEDRASFDFKVQFAEIYLNCLISGDREMLRQLCSQEYLKKNAIPQFTQQMLYEMYIYYHSTERLDNGMERVTYKLNYKIFRNNGTYRRDVGSDGAKPEYLVLLVSPDRTVRIENIMR